MELMMFIGEQDFYTWFQTGLSLKLLRNILELFKKSSILLPSTKYITIAILITNLFGKKHDVKEGDNWESSKKCDITILLAALWCDSGA